MLSYQIFVNGCWYHCDDHARYYNHRGPRTVVILTRETFADLVFSGELRSAHELGTLSSATELSK